MNTIQENENLKKKLKMASVNGRRRKLYTFYKCPHCEMTKTVEIKPVGTRRKCSCGEFWVQEYLPDCYAHQNHTPKDITKNITKDITNDDNI